MLNTKELQSQSEQMVWKLNTQFECTVKDTAQQYHLADLDFNNWSCHFKNCYANKHFQTATKLDNLTFIKIDGELKIRHEHFGKNHIFTMQL